MDEVNWDFSHSSIWRDRMSHGVNHENVALSSSCLSQVQIEIAKGWFCQISEKKTEDVKLEMSKWG